jgi:uncharacterized membrane protein YgcG
MFNFFKLTVLLFVFTPMLTLAYKGEILPQPEKPIGIVNDFINVISHSEREGLENKLFNLFKSTSEKIYVITWEFPEGTTQFDVEEFTNTLIKKWHPSDPSGYSWSDGGHIYMYILLEFHLTKLGHS